MAQQLVVAQKLAHFEQNVRVRQEVAAWCVFDRPLKRLLNRAKHGLQLNFELRVQTGGRGAADQLTHVVRVLIQLVHVESLRVDVLDFLNSALMASITSSEISVDALAWMELSHSLKWLSRLYEKLDTRSCDTSSW